ncbi:ferritin-like fold-containing protein [Isoptericola jiangsuensis]|uniref:ferritin-like fold-containing protein n=1 Tax=Isoptericola jiangsuensis TaxID=548579 RepID=UPI001476079F|nr:ferritin-like fold-containing protein [Isoptericola jiangsuensis]
MSSASTGAAGVDPTVPAGVVELVGLAAYTELAEFGLLAARSVDAPTLAARQALADGAARALAREHALLRLVSDGSAEAAGQVLGPFAGAFVDFDVRTRTDDWAEGLLRGVVGHGVAQDFARTLAAGVQGHVGTSLRTVLERPAPGREAEAAAGADAEAVRLLDDLAVRDEVLAARLALWGRRVVGEALSLVTVHVDTRPHLAALVGDAARTLGADGDPRSWLVARLTAEHTRRMDRLRLAA